MCDIIDIVAKARLFLTKLMSAGPVDQCYLEITGLAEIRKVAVEILSCTVLCSIH